MIKIESIIKMVLMMTLATGLLVACASDDQPEQRTETEDSALNTLTEQEEAEGWVLLFDGKTTEGWRGYGQDAFPESGWAIEDGTLRVIGGERPGDIIYDEKFQNFRLSLEWKVSEAGNSGIFYLAQELEDRPIWQSAPEMQILDNERHPDATQGVDGNRKAGSLYDLIPADPQNTKPAGEWNHAEILVYRGTVVHFQNGEQVLEYQLGTPAWEEMIANSKFADIADIFGNYEPGYIGLQDHNDDVWFRNIKIRKLD